MLRPLKVTAVALAATALLTGIAYAAPRAIPAATPGALQNSANLSLPGDVKSLEQILAVQGPINYKILVIDSIEGEDKTAYLDRVAAEWGQPAKDTLLLIVYTADNYDLRFYMGASFRANGVSVDEMLKLAREQYFATKRQGDVAGGLAKLISAVNQRMSVAAATATAPTANDNATEGAPVKEPTMQGFTVPDPFGGGERQTAAGQLQIAEGLLTAYLSQFKDHAIHEWDRLKEFRWDPNKLLPIYASDDELEFEIKYDVLPASPKTAWFAGNGERGENGWIVNKSQFMLVQKVGDKWALKALATSPAWRPQS